MRTPEELLCSRKWRIAHSWWVLLGFFPFAALAWVGYLIIGIRARNWKWLLISGLFLGWIIGWFAWAGSWGEIEKYAPHPDPVGNAWWGWLGLGIWLGNAFVLQWFVNRRWLVWRAHYRKRVWYQDATASRTAPAHQSPSTSAPSIIDAALAGTHTPASAHQPAVAHRAPQPQPSPADSSATVLDLNTASRNELASLPGLDAALADQIVITRERLGGFQDTAELVTAASMQPHIFAMMRNRIEVRPNMQTASPTPEAPASGRRLEF